jgi:hypothetical protein
MTITVSLSVIIIILIGLNVGLEYLFILWYRNITNSSDNVDIKSLKIGLLMTYIIRWGVVYKLIDDFIINIS